MIKGWIIYPEPTTENQRTNNAFGMMIKAAGKYGIDLKVMYREYFTIYCGKTYGIKYKNKEAEKPLFVFMRGYDDYLSRQFEMMGVRVFNTSDAMLTAQDKFLTHQKLCQAGIPTPLTYTGINDYETACNLIGSERFIMKSPTGSKGENVFIVENEKDFNQHRGLLVQEYIEYSHGKDIRVWVTGNKVTAAVLRYNNNSHLSNFSQGGSFKKLEIETEIADLALRSAQCTGLEISGIDILFRNKYDYTVCEVNGNAGFRTLYSAWPSIDLPGEIFSYISSVLEK